MKIKITKRNGDEFIVLVDSNLNGAIGIGGNGYAYIRIDGKPVYLHRYIMNAKKGEVVDHINGNKLDNRKENLRICTQADNVKNSRKRGTYKRKDKNLNKPWQARLNSGGKTIHVGYFATEEEARKAYESKHVEVYGKFSPYWEESN